MSDALVYLRQAQEQTRYNELHDMHVTAVHPGYAEVVLPAGELVLNPLGKVHGGALFTLCDVAAGTAAASRGPVAVTQQANISYLRPGEAGIDLVAATKELKHGRRSAVYEVNVTQNDKVIATGMFTMFYVDATVHDLK